jgi:transcriptional regulator with XRE-family HTH domain
MASFGEWLRRCREEMGLTQLDLGGLTGIHNVTISDYERGRRYPSLGNVAFLSGELQVDTSEMVARMVKEQLMKTEIGRIALAEFREGRFYGDE